MKNVVQWIIDNKDNIKCENATCSIKFLAVLGDIADSAEKSEFQKAKNILDKLNDYGIPYIPVFGNHDVWPYTDSGEATSTFGEDYFDEIFWSENATNTKLMKEKLGIKRDESNKKYKNFAFNFGGINFIGLDFNSRTHVPSWGLKTGVWPEAENWDETINWLKDCLIDHKACLKGYEENSNIIFSHHPFMRRSTDAFNSGEIDKIEEIIKNGNVLANFGGHIHGAYPFLLPWLVEYFMDANKEYDSINGTRVLTTEAIMVGSNREDDYLKEHDKGIIKIVKVLDENEIDYNTNEGKYKPDTGEGKEFIALNPYISFTFTQPTEILPCVFLKAHTFTKREVSYHWDLGDGTIGVGKRETHCYSSPGIYNVTLIVTDIKTGEKEFITQKIGVKEGIIPRFLKIAEEVKEKIELISAKLGEDLTKIGQVFKDNVFIKVKHSETTPVGIITVHFEQTNKDVDLTNMIADTNKHTKKSILYMPQWPSIVEKEKVLFILK